MAQAKLQLTIMAAEGLKNVKLLSGKMNPYAVAFVDPFVKQTTRVLRKGGVDPVWNDTMDLVLEERLLNDPYASLTIQIFNQSTIATSLVGATKLMLHDILGHIAVKGGDQADILTFQLWRPSGRPQGIVRVFLKLVGQAGNVPLAAEKGLASSSSNGRQGFPDIPATGVPVMPMPPYGQFYSANYASVGQSSSLPPPCHPAFYATASNKPDKYGYPYPSSYAPSYIPSQRRRNNNFLVGLAGGAVAALLLGSIF